ncbi:hypothetical protein GCM10010468_46980 [Actinocorallia longicatena]|uniref:Uncharacterized protein n=1 Tax=Actinocorallia longicatena TaxID=111803 RepID=A0ABP6QF20_9ACTN
MPNRRDCTSPKIIAAPSRSWDPPSLLVTVPLPVSIGASEPEERFNERDISGKTRLSLEGHPGRIREGPGTGP